MQGADADELDRLAAEFDRAADQLDRESGALSGILNNISWLGDAAGRYVSDWTGLQMPRIRLSTRFLRDEAANLRRQSNEQRAASGASTGTRFDLGSFPGSLPGRPFWPPPWVLPGGVLPDVPWGWLSHLNGGVGSLVDAISFDVTGELRDLKFGSLWFGALGSAGGILEDLFRDQGWTEAALAAGFTGVVGEVGSEGMSLAQMLKGAPVGLIGPGLAIVGGVSGFVSEYNASLEEGAGTGSLSQMGGDLIMAAGGVAMLIPGGQFVGGGLMVVGAAVDGAGWVVENWDDISDTAADTYRAVDSWVDDRVDDAIDVAVGIGNAAVDYAEDTVEQAAEFISGGWNRVKGWF